MPPAPPAPAHRRPRPRREPGPGAAAVRLRRSRVSLDAGHHRRALLLPRPRTTGRGCSSRTRAGPGARSSPRPRCARGSGSRRPGDRPWHVGVLLDNTPGVPLPRRGAALAGATIVGVNTDPARRRAGRRRPRDRLRRAARGRRAAPLLDGLDLGPAQVLGLDDRAYADLLAGHAARRSRRPRPHSTRPTRFLLLFTSGSTGAPKAVICSTGRFAVICQYTPLQLTRGDVAYNAMPMFHGNALMARWGPCLVPGATLALRRRFSASGFLPDLQRFGATFFNYVGRRCPTCWPSPSGPRSATTGSASASAPRRRRATGPSSSGASAARSLESYGSSEGICSIRRRPETPAGALGLPPAGQVVEVRAPDGTECPPAGSTRTAGCSTRTRRSARSWRSARGPSSRATRQPRGGGGEAARRRRAGAGTSPTATRRAGSGSPAAARLAAGGLGELRLGPGRADPARFPGVAVAAATRSLTPAPATG